MELRVLRYFREVASQQSFTVAARALNVSQPALSRQIQELEEELGTVLLIRGKRGACLTETGRQLFKYASEILELADHAKNNLSACSMEITGEVRIAGGETRAMSLVAKAMRKIREKHPGIIFKIFSGNAEAVAERLLKGLADFGAFIEPANLERFEYINLPVQDVWGLLIKKSDPLAERQFITPADLQGLPLICSAQHMVNNEIQGWMGGRNFSVIATYTLLYNAAIMVQEGVGYALCLDGIADISSESKICFRPLWPEIKVNIAIAWKKGQVFSQAVSIFRNFLLEEIGNSLRKD